MKNDDISKEKEIDNDGVLQHNDVRMKNFLSPRPDATNVVKTPLNEDASNPYYDILDIAGEHSVIYKNKLSLYDKGVLCEFVDTTFEQLVQQKGLTNEVRKKVIDEAVSQFMKCTSNRVSLDICKREAAERYMLNNLLYGAVNKYKNNIEELIKNNQRATVINLVAEAVASKMVGHPIDEGNLDEVNKAKAVKKTAAQRLSESNFLLPQPQLDNHLKP